MDTKELKEYVEEQWKRTVKLGETNYSEEVLAFAYTLGLPPSECTNMYVESDWKQEWIDDYDKMVSLIHTLKKGGKR